MERSDKGENSRKNECVDEEKPFKKARYVWEVKGKHHLKYSSNDSLDASTSRPDTEGGNIEDDLPKLSSDNGYDLPPRPCCFKTFISRTEDLMERDSSDEDDSEKLPLESTIENEIPVTLVSVQPKNQDYYLRKWQARQIARGFVDNTINSMLENCLSRPFDATNFVEDCDNDGQVEDDAILMAIQSHGLQSGWRGPNSRQSDSVSNSTSNSSVSSCGSISNTAGNSSCGSTSNSLGSNTIVEQAINYENLQKEHESESSVASTSSSMSVDTVSSISNPFEEDLGDPMSFLNAAVSVAIQKKGLTYG